MKVNVYVRPVEGKDKFKGYADAIINGITIRDLQIVEGQYGLFVRMPTRQNLKTNEYVPIVSGVSKEVSNALTEACKQALTNDAHQATVGEKAGDMNYDVHYHNLDADNLLGVASITCREKGAEKSMFTIQNVKALEYESKDGKKFKSVQMPSKKDTSKEKATYIPYVKFGNDKTQKFVESLVLGKVKEAQKQFEPQFEPQLQPWDEIPDAAYGFDPEIYEVGNKKEGFER